jgi:class 3 adenylate cyclase/tetratricopeptide (TPR) repeat protein
MNCPRCRHENELGAKFCEECAAPLSRACGRCGRPLSATAKFCPECAQPTDLASSARMHAADDASRAPEAYTPKHLAERILVSRSALEGERKQVTVLFADLKGSMELLANRDPEEARKILDPVLERMMEAVHRYEGTVNQVMGDGIMALFGAPLAHEDHAVRACFAALRMQEAVAGYAADIRRREGVPIRIRVGLNSGEVVVRSIGSDLRMDYTAVGETTHLAARMEQMADPGTILATAATLDLAEGFVEAASLGPVPVRGLAAPVDVYEVTGAGAARTRLQAAARRGLTQFVGRGPELEHLSRARQAASQGQGQIAAIVGVAGVGKSRLLYEFTHTHRLDGWLVLHAACVSYGQGSSYLPVIDLLKHYFKIEGRDDLRAIREKVTGRLLTLDRALEPTLPAILELLGGPVADPAWRAMEPGQRRRQTLDAVRRLILREAREQPLLLVVEDLHWIDPETQALLNDLVESLAGARLLILVNYRPEYQHSWGGKSAYSQLRLDALPVESAGALLEALLGDNADLAPLKQLLVRRGNPFFLEESIRTLVETGILVGEPGRYRCVQPVHAIRIPATVQVILAARIDRLAPDDKRLLQIASVIGRHVPGPLLHQVADVPEDGLRRGLDRLRAAEFLYETQLFPEPEYSFTHALTHDVTYGGLLQERRRALHGHTMTAIERLAGERRAEHVERLAHHAFEAEDWDKTLTYAREAGAKAAARWALPEACTHFERALTALGHLPEDRTAIELAIDLRVELRNASHFLGQQMRGRARLLEALTLAEKLGDLARVGNTSLLLGSTNWMLGNTAAASEALARAGAIGEATADDLLAITARGMRGYLEHDRGAFASAARVFEGYLTELEAAGFASTVIGLAPRLVAAKTYLLWCLAELGHFVDGRRLAGEALEFAAAQTNPAGTVLASMGAGFVHLRQGDAPAAIPLLERGLQICRAIGLTALAFNGVATFLGIAYTMVDRTDEGVPLLTTVADRAAELGLASDHLLAAIPLGHAYLDLGRRAEAVALAERSLERARTHGQRGHEVYALRLLAEAHSSDTAMAATTAERHYSAALQLAGTLGMRPATAHCHRGLARLYRRTGQTDRAVEHRGIAMAMYREMEMTYWLTDGDPGERRPAE